VRLCIYGSKYLGLPALVGADRSDCFLHFLEKIIQQIKWVDGETIIIGGERISIESRALGYYYLCNVSLSNPERSMQKNDGCYMTLWWVDDENSKKML
jgi:hypothetical protein